MKYSSIIWLFFNKKKNQNSWLGCHIANETQMIRFFSFLTILHKTVYNVDDR